MTGEIYVGHRQGESHYDSLMNYFHVTDEQLSELCDALEDARLWDKAHDVEIIDFDY